MQWQTRIAAILAGTLGIAALAVAENHGSSLTSHYELAKGAGVDVCEAYKHNFEHFDNARPMACERKYNPSVKGFSSPAWKKLDLKKYFYLYKKAEIYLKEGYAGITKKEILNGIEGRAKHQKVELDLARLDLDGDGKLVNVLAVKDFGCGPNPSMTEEYRATRLYILNDSLTDIDYKRQDSWDGWYNNATIELYEGIPYIEHYEPDDGWGNLLTGSGRLYVMRDETIKQLKKEFPGKKITGRLKSVCEIRYVISKEKKIM